MTNTESLFWQPVTVLVTVKKYFRICGVEPELVNRTVVEGMFGLVRPVVGDQLYVAPTKLPPAVPIVPDTPLHNAISAPALAVGSELIVIVRVSWLLHPLVALVAVRKAVRTSGVVPVFVFETKVGCATFGLVNNAVGVQL